MERATAPTFNDTRASDLCFCDGLGERWLTSNAMGLRRERLCIRSELTAVPSFEFAVRERVHRLEDFRHPYFVPAVSVERVNGDGATLALLSDRAEGVRLSALFSRAAARGLNLDINAALCLIRQIVPAVARLHELHGDVSHGALGPERVVLTPSGRLMITEYVLGDALEQLRYSQERYWRELRVAVPHSAGLPRFDHRTDVTQIGVIALSLVLGRSLRDDEYPSRVGDVLLSAKAIAPKGGFEPLPPSLRSWLSRALQMDVRQAFATAAEAHDELERVVADLEYPGLPASVDGFLARYADADPAPAVVASPFPDAPLSSFTPEVDLPRREGSQAPLSESDLAGVDLDSLEADFASEADLCKTTAWPAEWVSERPPTHADASRVAGELFAEVQAPRRRSMVPIGVGIVVAVIGAGVPLWGRLAGGKPGTLGTGTLVISTSPRGAAASLDGRPLGVTPLTVSVATGAHTLEVRGDGEPKTVAVVMTAGARVEQYIELPVPTPTSVAGADAPNMMSSDSAPPPATASDPKVATTVAVAPSTPVAPSTGWLVVKAPIDLVIEEGGVIIGHSASGRVSLLDGRHVLTLRNESLGFQTTQTAQVSADKVTTATVEVPNGLMSLNASPWAEVWLDGSRVGETPIGNLAVPIGPHDVMLRHPALGEQRRTVVVPVTGVSRLSVDFRGQPAQVTNDQ